MKTKRQIYCSGNTYELNINVAFFSALFFLRNIGLDGVILNFHGGMLSTGLIKVKSDVLQEESRKYEINICF